MKVTMKLEIDSDKIMNFQVGDQIKLGSRYTATCQKVGKKGAIFMFDQYLNKTMPMNKEASNQGSYSDSVVRSYLKSFSKDSIFDEIREMMRPFKNGDLLRIPTAEEMFGLEIAHEKYEAINNKKQWPLMKNRLNRVALRGKDQKWEWGWIQNRRKESTDYFALINSNGDPGYSYASPISGKDGGGIRVVFRLSLD